MEISLGFRHWIDYTMVWMVRVARIELAFQPWEGRVIPLNYTRSGAISGTRTPDLHFTKVAL